MPLLVWITGKPLCHNDEHFCIETVILEVLEHNIIIVVKLRENVKLLLWITCCSTFESNSFQNPCDSSPFDLLLLHIVKDWWWSVTQVTQGNWLNSKPSHTCIHSMGIAFGPKMLFYDASSSHELQAIFHLIHCHNLRNIHHRIFSNWSCSH